MANIILAEVTLHVDESLDAASRAKLEKDLRGRSCVVDIQHSEKAPHLWVVKYDSSHATSKDILRVALGESLHAELIGGI